MFRSNKNTNKYHNYIIVSEKDTGVRNYHFSRKFAFIAIGISVLSISTVLFFTANALTGVMYKTKMNNLRSSYEHLSETLTSLQNQLDNVSGEVGVIEEKDQAIRTYAGLPQIDQDVRKLGVGGTDFKVNAIDDIPNDITNRITEIEMNVNALSRKVKLELNSYNNLYDVVRNHSDNLKFVPSIRPVQSGYINSGYGYRKDPFNGNTRFPLADTIMNSAKKTKKIDNEKKTDQPKKPFEQKINLKSSNDDKNVSKTDDSNADDKTASSKESK